MNTVEAILEDVRMKCLDAPGFKTKACIYFLEQKQSSFCMLVKEAKC